MKKIFILPLLILFSGGVFAAKEIRHSEMADMAKKGWHGFGGYQKWYS